MAISILFGGEKGGVGKSTFSFNMAIMSTLMGYDTVFIDTDPQHSTSKIFGRRRDRVILPAINCINLKGKHLHSEIDSLAEKYDRVIIDAGGKDSIELRSAMVASSVTTLYAPLQPTTLDMDTIEKLDELTELSQTYNTDLTTQIILNRCRPNKKVKITTDAKTAIQDYSDHIKLCPIVIFDRVVHEHAISHCLAIVEYDAQQVKNLPEYRLKTYPLKATEEMMALYKHIFNENFKPLIPNKLLSENLETTA